MAEPTSKRTVAVTLTEDQTSRIIKGGSIQINLPPGAGTLILQAKAKSFDSLTDAILGNVKRAGRF